MHPRGLVVAAAVGACVPVPPFRNEQPALLTVDRVTGDVASTTSAPVLYAVKFADHGVRAPQTILVEGVEILRAGSCPYEGGVGVTVYPALTAIAPALGGSDATGTLTVEWAGPVIARVVITWSSQYTCNASAQEAHGTSAFTLFPNGRIVRSDAATPSTTLLTIDGSACGCATDNKFNFSSFWSLQPAAEAVLPAGTPWVDGASAFGCAVYPSHTVGVGFSELSRARLVTATGASTFVYDWAHEATTLAPDERQTVSAILLSKESQASRCGEVTADLADPPITIAGTAGIASDVNGIYPGPALPSGLSAISSPVAMPRGFAVSLALVALPVVERQPPAAGAWYAAQREGDRLLL
jgi:hypothetical protein